MNWGYVGPGDLEDKPLLTTKVEEAQVLSVGACDSSIIRDVW